MAKTAENRAKEPLEEPAQKRAKGPSEVIYRTLGNPAKETFRGHALDKCRTIEGDSGRRVSSHQKNLQRKLKSNLQKSCAGTSKGTAQKRGKELRAM